MREQLIQLQERAGMSNREFARCLNISYATWRAIKEDRRGIGAQTQERVLKVFPEMLESLLPKEE